MLEERGEDAQRMLVVWLSVREQGKAEIFEWQLELAADELVAPQTIFRLVNIDRSAQRLAQVNGFIICYQVADGLCVRGLDGE